MNSTEQLFKVNGTEVIKGLCSVAFNVRAYFKSSDLTGMNPEPVSVTHNTMYEMVSNAHEVHTKDLLRGVLFRLELPGYIFIDVYKKL